jgi:ribonuclease III
MANPQNDVLPPKATKRLKVAAAFKLKKLFGIPFKKIKRLEAALTHPSFRNENPKNPLEDFDRLEFFGDTVLNFVVCRKLYQLFPEADEGVLSRLRSILVSRKILSRVAKEIKLPKFIKLGRSLIKQQQFMKAKLFADALEAFIAAVYFDRGFPAAEKFILKHFNQYFDAKKLFRLDPNPKSTLQELVQKHWQRLPNYNTEITPEGAKTTVSIGRSRETVAVSRTRRESEEKAARQMIRDIRQELLGRANKKSSGKKLRKTF